MYLKLDNFIDKNNEIIDLNMISNNKDEFSEDFKSFIENNYDFSKFREKEYILKNYNKFLGVKSIYKIVDLYLEYKNERNEEILKRILFEMNDNKYIDEFITIKHPFEVKLKNNFFKKCYFKIVFEDNYNNRFFLRKEYFLISIILENIEGNCYMTLNIEEEYNELTIIEITEDNNFKVILKDN